MGHEIHHNAFPLSMSKDAIYNEVNEHCRYESDSRGDLYEPIRWYDTVCDDYNAAMKFIEGKDYSYANIAVKYKHYPSKSSSKAAEELSDRIRKQNDSLNKIVKDAHVSNRTSEYIGCPKCGSSLKRTFLRGDFCPLCNADLRSKTNIDRIANAKNKLNELNKKLDEQIKKDNKPEICWLVKTEFHV